MQLKQQSQTFSIDRNDQIRQILELISAFD